MSGRAPSSEMIDQAVRDVKAGRYGSASLAGSAGRTQVVLEALLEKAKTCPNAATKFRECWASHKTMGGVWKPSSPEMSRNDTFSFTFEPWMNDVMTVDEKLAMMCFFNNGVFTLDANRIFTRLRAEQILRKLGLGRMYANASASRMNEEMRSRDASDQAMDLCLLAEIGHPRELTDIDALACLGVRAFPTISVKEAHRRMQFMVHPDRNTCLPERSTKAFQLMQRVWDKYNDHAMLSEFVGIVRQRVPRLEEIGLAKAWSLWKGGVCPWSSEPEANSAEPPSDPPAPEANHAGPPSDPPAPEASSPAPKVLGFQIYFSFKTIIQQSKQLRR